MILLNVINSKNGLKCKKNRLQLETLLKQNVPVFWIIGPSGCGKSTLAEMLTKSSKYRLIDVKAIIKDEVLKWNKPTKLNKKEKISSDVLLSLLKKEIMQTSQNAVGYIIDGFPTNLTEAKLFEKNICHVNVIIYLTLVLDGLLARKVTQVGAFNVNEERIHYIKVTSNLKKISRHYSRKIIQLHSNYPPEATCTKLIEILEDFWGYKFLRLYNKQLGE